MLKPGGYFKLFPGSAKLQVNLSSSMGSIWRMFFDDSICRGAPQIFGSFTLSVVGASAQQVAVAACLGALDTLGC